MAAVRTAARRRPCRGAAERRGHAPEAASVASTVRPGRGWRSIDRGKELDMKRAFVGAILLLCAACATEAKYQQYVNGFVGQNASQLYATWGAPLRSATLPNGGQAVSFLSNVQGGRGFGVAGCETTFILDKAGIVREASFRGDACYH